MKSTDDSERKAIEAYTASISQYKDAIDNERTALRDYARALEDSRAALIKYQWALAKADAKTTPHPGDQPEEQLFSTLAAGDLTVAAIFFAFFGFAIGQILGISGDTLRDRAIRTLYRRIVFGTGVGVGVSVAATLLCIVASQSRSAVWSDSALLFSIFGITAVLAITMYLMAKLIPENWKVQEDLELPDQRP